MNYLEEIKKCNPDHPLTPLDSVVQMGHDRGLSDEDIAARLERIASHYPTELLDGACPIQYAPRQHTSAHQATDSSEGTKQEDHRNTQASQTTDTDNNKGNKGTEEAKSIE